jgi:hypothetical protein
VWKLLASLFVLLTLGPCSISHCRWTPHVSHLPLSHGVFCSDSKPTEAVDANSKSYRILGNSHAKSPYKDWGPICALGFPSMRRPCPRLASPYRLIWILRTELSSPMPALPPCCQALSSSSKKKTTKVRSPILSLSFCEFVSRCRALQTPSCSVANVSSLTMAITMPEILSRCAAPL